MLGTLSILLCGGLWALLYHLLAADGLQPSSDVGALFPAETLYAHARLYVLPLVWVLWQALILVTDRLNRVGPWNRLNQPLGLVWGLSVTVCLILPELIAFLWAGGGPEGLATISQIARFAGGVAALVVWIGATLVVRQRRQVGWLRALGSVLLALVVQALIAGPFLR